MKTRITYKDIMSYKPCYDPEKLGLIDKEKSLTIPEFINEYRDRVTDKSDIIWVVCREEYMSDKDMRLFAVWCAREALKLIDDPDPRSIKACDVAERYANGEATNKELYAARAAARDAAPAARAAPAAAWPAWNAARDAARDAARAAAWDAACAAWDDWDAVWAAQTEKLLTYFES